MKMWTWKQGVMYIVREADLQVNAESMTMKELRGIYKEIRDGEYGVKAQELANNREFFGWS